MMALLLVSEMCFVRVCPVFYLLRRMSFPALLYKETVNSTIVPSFNVHVLCLKYTYDNNNQYYSTV
jgi:hypothetical protein